MLAICSLMLIFSATIVFSQKVIREKSIECKSKLTVRGKFKTLFVGSSGGTSFHIYIKIDLRNQTDENYLATANQLKAKYCKEEERYIAFFDTREHYELNGIPQPDRPLEGTPRALYVINRLTGREILEVYKIVDGRIKTREIIIK
ncbi:MAG: hypothetical protein ACKVQW_10670 [Pyrinomonadaceae bacterium]